VSVLDREIAAMNALAIFSSGPALALIFCLGLAMVKGSSTARHRRTGRTGSTYEIKAAQRLGFTPKEVAELLEAGRHRHGRPVAGLQARAAAKLAEADAKIADLTTICTALAAAVDPGCVDLTVCASSSCCSIPFTDLTSPRRTALPDPAVEPGDGSARQALGGLTVAPSVAHVRRTDPDAVGEA
jgi:hypothetical protein